MKYLLQFDFPFNGPFKKEFTKTMENLAKDISSEKGLVFKLWTENEDTKEAGGIYVFDNKEDANRYLQMHKERLEAFGIKDINTKVFEINEELSKICKATFI